jgi:hypothetical protein
MLLVGLGAWLVVMAASAIANLTQTSGVLFGAFSVSLGLALLVHRERARPTSRRATSNAAATPHSRARSGKGDPGAVVLRFPRDVHVRCHPSVGVPEFGRRKTVSGSAILSLPTRDPQPPQQPA